ncbi:YlzJ-like family protein [Paenibacillus sp. J2TS4]|uniref:YlzJ-like family protein n=1 Tax=Paenibacillus sp. J2TS4 TaxID=2807194 RepID=UPI001B2F5D47|nr:YlzJ-like family protein [Paenibacillus sp. J2TS4]GIP33130.1 hypothetical protein J2TS4_23400 [Paenibacillus sp. J2TS4]
MTIHSIVPIERIMEGSEEADYSYEQIQLNGMEMQVQRISANQAKIIRIFSPQANDYLNPAYAPGTVITFSPQWDGSF